MSQMIFASITSNMAKDMRESVVNVIFGREPAPIVIAVSCSSIVENSSQAEDSTSIQKIKAIIKS